MKLVVFGLTVSSSWGNGHATLWRGLCNALGRAGHGVVFFEKNVPYYAAHRDLQELPRGTLVLYHDWQDVLPVATAHTNEADVAMVTSYCPDAVAASELVLASRAALRTFYDLDTPVTLSNLKLGKPVPYIPPGGLGDFDLVLSYTGGTALVELQARLGARMAVPLYGSVDPQVHRPVRPVGTFRCDLSYLGTYAEDRQQALRELFIDAAAQLPDQKFLIGGSMYPEHFPWADNIFFVRHVAPAEHPAFYCSSRLTLNVTRRPMAEMGYCPSGRLFEAAACGAPILTDWWVGLDEFFEPGSEIIVAQDTENAVRALRQPPEALARVAQAARERVLAEHTAAHRARQMLRYFKGALNSLGPGTPRTPLPASPRRARAPLRAAPE